MKIASRFPRIGAVLALLLFAAADLSAATAASRKVPTHDDIWLMRRVGPPLISPDGRWIVVSVGEPSYENDTLSDLWLIDTSAGRTSRRLTSTRRPENGVVWSPDSRRIVFSSQREGDDVPQLYMLNLAEGGEAVRLTTISGGARAPSFSHDGRQIAFVSIMFAGALDEQANKERIAALSNRKANVRIFEGFPIRSWDRWLDDRQVRVFVMPLDDSGLPAGAPRDLLAGTRLAASPGFAGRQTDTGEELEIEFTPDNKAVVFAATTNRNQSASAFTDAQLFIAEVTGGEPRAITSGGVSWSFPRFTPDGGTLLAVVENTGPNVYNAARLAAFSWPALGQPRIVTGDIDRSVSSYAVTPDSRRIYFTAEDLGSEKLYSVAVTGGKVSDEIKVDEGSYTNIAIAQRAGSFVMFANWESASVPAEIAYISTQTGRHIVLTKFNTARTAKLDLPRIQDFWFTSSRGKRIHSFVVRPPGFEPSKRYPLFVVIHGGPHGMWRDQFFIRWNYHLLASPGYVLLLTNYSGSTGFGEAFARSIQGDPLKGPADEINEAADAAIREFAFIDGSRQCAGGASYGGHLANWLQATTTRYKCLVSHAGLVNLESQWGTSDTIYSREVNMGGPPWEQNPLWREQNPIRYADRFRTPVLVTIGENDFRVPLNNTLEYWSALQRKQVPSRLLVFPDENHWILKGENSRLFYSELSAWLARWLAPVD